MTLPVCGNFSIGWNLTQLGEESLSIWKPVICWSGCSDATELTTGGSVTCGAASVQLPVLQDFSLCVSWFSLVVSAVSLAISLCSRVISSWMRLFKSFGCCITWVPTVWACCWVCVFCLAEKIITGSMMRSTTVTAIAVCLVRYF